MIWLDADQFDIGFCHQRFEALQQRAIPGFRLTQERDGEPNTELHALPDHLQKALGCWMVTVLGYFMEVLLVHALIEQAMGNVLDGRALWNWLGRQFNPSWLMHNGIHHEIAGHPRFLSIV